MIIQVDRENISNVTKASGIAVVRKTLVKKYCCVIENHLR